MLPTSSNLLTNQGDEEDCSRSSHGQSISFGQEGELMVSLIANDYGSNQTPPRTQNTAIEGNEISIDEAVDKLGTGYLQYQILWAVGMCFMADAFEIMVMAFISVILRNEWNLSVLQTASLSSCVFTAELIGGLVLGSLGDRIGRYPVFLASAVLVFLFGNVTAFSNGYVSMILGRSMVGFGVSSSNVPFDLLAELSPTSSRGRLLIGSQYLWSLGSFLVPIVAYLTIGGYNSWRLFLVICSIPSLISIVFGVLYIPESPRWLLSKGKESKALNVLRAAALTNGKDPDVLFPPGTRLKDHVREENNCGELLSPKHRKNTLLLWVIFTGYALCYYSVIFQTTKKFATHEGNGITEFSYGIVIFTSSSELVGSIILFFLIDRIGRVATQVYTFVFGGVTMFLFCFSAAKKSKSILMAMAFLTRMFDIMGSNGAWVSASEVYDTEIRSTGHAVAYSLARIGAALGPFLISGKIPIKVVGIVLFLMHMIIALCASRLTETKGRNI